MPNTSPETDGSDIPDFLPRDNPPPEHISMEDMAYIAHLINNAIAVIKVNINYVNDPDIQEELRRAKEIMIRRINFLLTHYQEDLRNMPDVKNFLELLKYLTEQDQFQHATNLHQLAVQIFKMGGTLSKPGRHLSTEKPTILFADDEPVLTYMFKEMAEERLGSTEHPVDILLANSGQKALDIIKDTKSRLIAVLTDLGLGDGPNGNAVAKAALSAGIKHVAICTGSEDKLTCDDIRNRVTLIKKPFGIQELLDFCTQAILQQ